MRIAEGRESASWGVLVLMLSAFAIPSFVDCGANFSLNSAAPRAQLYTGLSQRF